MKITETYEGKEFELIFGKEYEFSDHKTSWKIGVLTDFDIKASEGSFYVKSDTWYCYIRPIQPKVVLPITTEELYRICGNKGYELFIKKKKAIVYGIAQGVCGGKISINSIYRNVTQITHFRKAYSQDEWKPIAEIEREA